MRRSRLAVALFAALAAWAAPAGAQPSSDPVETESAAELWQRGQVAEQAADPARAVGAYETLVDAHPTHRLATRARRRLAFLKDRAEGGYEPLAVLLAAQRRPSTAAELAELDERLEAMPPGRVRIELRQLIANSWLREDEGLKAEAAFRAIHLDPAATEADRRAAQRGVARALEAQGRPGEALAELGMDETPARDRLASAARARVGRWVALAVLLLFLLAFAGFSRLRLDRPVWRRLVDWRFAAFAVWLLGFPWLLATLYDGEAWDTFAMLALASAPLLLCSVWLGAALRERSAPRWQRWAGALAAVAGQAAIGYLVLVERGAVLGVGP